MVRDSRDDSRNGVRKSGLRESMRDQFAIVVLEQTVSHLLAPITAKRLGEAGPCPAMKVLYGRHIMVANLRVAGYRVREKFIIPQSAILNY